VHIGCYCLSPATMYTCKEFRYVTRQIIAQACTTVNCESVNWSSQWLATCFRWESTLVTGLSVHSCHCPLGESQPLHHQPHANGLMVQLYVNRRLEYSNPPAPPHACLEGDVDTLLGNRTHYTQHSQSWRQNHQSIVNTRDQDTAQTEHNKNSFTVYLLARTLIRKCV